MVKPRTRRSSVTTLRTLAIAALACATLVAGAQAVATPPTTGELAAGQTCGERPYRDRTQAPRNAAGLIFVPRGDVFRVWDNARDNHLVRIWFNYGGVADKWKYVGAPSDGGQGPIVRNVSEKYRYICFYVHTDSPRWGDSPVVRYTTRG
jgi:hypothetical protein